MTNNIWGLNIYREAVCQVLITDGNLELVDKDGIEFVIKTEKRHLVGDEPYCFPGV